MVTEDSELDEPVSDKEEPKEESKEESRGIKKDSWLQGDLPPRGKKKYCMWAMLHNKTEDELEAEGYNPGTVRIAAWELEKMGLRKRVKGPPPPGTELVKVQVNGKSPQIFARGSPPEALVEAISIPVEDGHIEGFEKGLKFGANMIILGVRVAQELSNLGIAQARPIIDMAKDMRTGEAAAAKNAAAEAAMMTAAHVEQTMMPYLASLQKPTGGEADPMKSMMVRAMEPLLKNMMGRMMPGAQTGTPEGWTVKQE